MRWTVAEVADALGVAAPSGADSVARLAGVSIDSRTVKHRELFVAIRGPRHDGHNFVAAALVQGAVAAVVERDRASEFPPGIRERLLAVDDTLRALQESARSYCDAWRNAKPGRRVAAVTGSAGKTTTKEILAALLAARFRVLKSEGNLNNEYGLPLTLFRLGDEHDAAVVELGMSHRGELARLEEIALATRELIEGLGGAEPVAVLNADDARVSRFADGFRGRTLFFGASENAQFRAEHIEDRGIGGSAFDFEAPDELGRLTLPLAGQHNVLNALAALAAASEWGIRIADAKKVFPNLRAAAMRGEFLRFEAGFAVINDCYNSNPVALECMIDLLCATPGYRRRILVAGEMRELGVTSPQLHRSAGQYAAAKNGIDCI